MVFRLPNAQLSKERSVSALFKVYWDWIQFVFKMPLLWEGKRGLSPTARELMQGSALLCSALSKATVWHISLF